MDAGSSGWRSFPDFKKNMIDRSQTRVLAFLNIVGQGMRGGAFEQDVTDMDPKLTSIVAKANKKDIVGIKQDNYEGFEWAADDMSSGAGKQSHIHVIIDFCGSKQPLSIE